MDVASLTPEVYLWQQQLYDSLCVFDLGDDSFSKLLPLLQCRIISTGAGCFFCVFKREWTAVLADVILGQRSESNGPEAQKILKNETIQAYARQLVHFKTTQLFDWFQERSKGLNVSWCAACCGQTILKVAGFLLLKEFKSDLIHWFNDVRDDCVNLLKESFDFYRVLVRDDCSSPVSINSKVNMKPRSKKQFRRVKKRTEKEERRLQRTKGSASTTQSPQEDESPTNSSSELSLKLSSLACCSEDSFTETSDDLMVLADEIYSTLGSDEHKSDYSRLQSIISSTQILGNNGYHCRRGPRYAVTIAIGADIAKLGGLILMAVQQIFFQYLWKTSNCPAFKEIHETCRKSTLNHKVFLIVKTAIHAPNFLCPCCTVDQLFVNYITQHITTALRYISVTDKMLPADEKPKTDEEKMKWLLDFYRFLERAERVNKDILSKLIGKTCGDGAWGLTEVCYNCSKRNASDIFDDAVFFSPAVFKRDFEKRIQTSVLKILMKNSKKDDMTEEEGRL